MPTWIQQFTDNFTRADTAAGTVGNGWVVTGANAFQVLSNKLHSLGSNGFVSNPGLTGYTTERVVIATKGQASNGQYIFTMRFIQGTDPITDPPTGLEFNVAIGAPGAAVLWGLQPIGGNFTYSLRSTGVSPAANHDLTFDLSLSGGLPTVARLYIQDNSNGNSTVIDDSFTWTTANPLQTQVGSIRLWGAACPTDTYSVTYYNGVSGVGQVAPTATTRTTISLSFTSGSAAAGPYDRSLYRSTVSDFTAPGAGTLVSTLTGESGSSSTWTDTPPGSPAGGSVFYYQCVEVAADASTTTSYSSGAALAYDPLRVLLIGDSIAHNEVQSYWDNAMVAYPGHSIILTERAIAGTTSQNWEPADVSANLTDALAAGVAAGCTWACFSLGMNDSLSIYNHSAAAYKASISLAANYAVSAGLKVQLDEPSYGCPDPGLGQWNKSPDLLAAYSTALDQLVDNVNIFKGGRQIFRVSMNDQTVGLGGFGIHPAAELTQKNVNSKVASLMHNTGVTGTAPATGGGGGGGTANLPNSFGGGFL